jgi:hypothetical protein
MFDAGQPHPGDVLGAEAHLAETDQPVEVDPPVGEHRDRLAGGRHDRADALADLGDGAARPDALAHQLLALEVEGRQVAAIGGEALLLLRQLRLRERDPRHQAALDG